MNPVLLHDVEELDLDVENVNRVQAIAQHYKTILYKHLHKFAVITDHQVTQNMRDI